MFLVRNPASADSGSAPGNGGSAPGDPATETKLSTEHSPYGLDQRGPGNGPDVNRASGFTTVQADPTRPALARQTNPPADIPPMDSPPADVSPADRALGGVDHPRGHPTEPAGPGVLRSTRTPLLSAHPHHVRALP
jgi:hypothetical protein